MASWKPSTVEDIRKWLAGEYVLNPTDREYWEQLKARIKAKLRETPAGE
jgi:hypothetical protein